MLHYSFKCSNLLNEIYNSIEAWEANNPKSCFLIEKKANDSEEKEEEEEEEEEKDQLVNILKKSIKKMESTIMQLAKDFESENANDSIEKYYEISSNFYSSSATIISVLGIEKNYNLRRLVKISNLISDICDLIEHH